MRSCLADAAIFDDDDHVGPGDRAQAMGDHEARASLHQNGPDSSGSIVRFRCRGCWWLRPESAVLDLPGLRGLLPIAGADRR